MFHCIFCNQENPPEARLCNKAGSPLYLQPRPHCGSTMEKTGSVRPRKPRPGASSRRPPPVPRSPAAQARDSWVIGRQRLGEVSTATCRFRLQVPANDDKTVVKCKGGQVFALL